MSLTVKIACRIAFFKDYTIKTKGVVRVISTNSIKRNEFVLGKKPGVFFKSSRFLSKLKTSGKEQLTQTQKRLIKKKKMSEEGVDGFRVAAFSTAEEYNLESLKQALPHYTAFTPTTFSSEFGNLTDFVHAVKNSQTGSEIQELFFFRKGSIVMWNIPEFETWPILDFLRYHEDSSFPDNVVKNESEFMSYIHSSDINKTTIVKDQLVFSPNTDLNLEKYAISNAMGLSVHLGTYESNLEQYIETMEPVTEDLKAGVEIKMSREEVLRKTGQLFSLRHKITLSSDLLDTPDFYWDREELENLYQATFSYFCISKRTRVMSERINHCIELVQLLSSHLNDKHHVRLEWMIIILIMVEVGFEIVHYLDRYLEGNKIKSTSVSTSPNYQ